MPYARKSLTEIRNEAIQDITSADISDGKGNSISFLLQKAVLRVLAWVWAGFSYEHYGYLDWISLQSTPWGATDEYAAGWGALINVTQIDAFGRDSGHVSVHHQLGFGFEDVNPRREILAVAGGFHVGGVRSFGHRRGIFSHGLSLLSK